MEVEISFRIFHSKMSPSLISDKLGLEPKHSWTAGEPRKTPQNKLLEGINKESFWSFHIEHSEHKHLSEIIKDFLNELYSKNEFLKDVRMSGGRSEFFIGIMPETQIYGDVLGYELLREVSNLGIDLAISVYK